MNRLPGVVLAGLLAMAGGVAARADGTQAAPSPQAAPTRAAEAADHRAAAPGVQARLATPAVLRGGFQQEKHLAGFQRPLRSSGRFLLVRGRGIAWDTQAPFASEAVLSQGRLFTRLPDGRTQVLLDGAQSPGAAAANALLLALLAGDLDVLARDFELRETVDGDAWTLDLVPRPGPLARAFVHLTLSGDRHVREVDFEESNGDRTRIRFEAVEEADAPDPAEAARLG